MNPNDLTLSQDEYDAHLLLEVIDASSPPGETAEERHTRSAAIIETFKAFEPGNVMESMIACHCIALRAMMNAAIRDAGNLNLDPAMLTRMRATATAMSKNLHLWMLTYENLRARNEIRAAEARQRASQPAAMVARAKPEPDSEKHPPARQDQSRPMAAQPPKPVPPPVQPGAAALLMPDKPAPGTPAPGMKQALQSSAAVIQDPPPNGRLNIMPPAAGT